MSETQIRSETRMDLDHDQLMSVLFANMVLQHTNMALVFLGKAPHPEKGGHIVDLDAAQMFIDQLEMLETKTKGNLKKDEEHLLKQSLMTLRMAFVEAFEKQPPQSPTAEAAGAEAAAPASAAPGQETKTEPAAEPEPRKKFTKKY